MSTRGCDKGMGPVDEPGLLADRFEVHRSHLRAVAYRMLGSFTDADDAVQETWLRFSRSDTSIIENLRGWLTTVVGRVSLNMLRARKTRREETLDWQLPDPVIDPIGGVEPEHEVILADAVGMALLVVLDTLHPAERLAFVLHDMFAVPFEEIAPIVERTPAASRQLASRARRRVKEAAPGPDADLDRQREVVDAFFAAAREGEFGALVRILDPEVVLRVDAGVLVGGRREVRGAEQVARQATLYAEMALDIRPVLVNGLPGALALRDGRPFSLGALVVRGGRIVAMDLLADPARLGQLDPASWS